MGLCVEEVQRDTRLSVFSSVYDFVTALPGALLQQLQWRQGRRCAGGGVRLLYPPSFPLLPASLCTCLCLCQLLLRWLQHLSHPYHTQSALSGAAPRVHFCQAFMKRWYKLLLLLLLLLWLETVLLGGPMSQPPANWVALCSAAPELCFHDNAAGG